MIRLPEDAFFICVPSIFHSFAFRHLDSLFQAAGLGKQYEKRRAEFLEQDIQVAIQVGLPSAQLFSGSHYLLVGNWLIVVEAKSHKINRPAQRGAHDSLADAIQKLIVEERASITTTKGSFVAISRPDG